jgi:hypothetical protein
MDTPGSTTVNLGHEAEMSPFMAATQVPLATDATDLVSNDVAWEFELMDNIPPARIAATQVLLATDATDLASNNAAWEFELMDNSPPARPPSPVSPHPSTSPFPSPKSDVAMEIPWGPCDGCHLMALLASVPTTEVRLFFSFVLVASYSIDI